MLNQTVYFIRAGASGPVKIGIAEDVPKRLRQLQTGQHETLVLLGTADGGAEMEAALHARFAADRIRGEWFKASPELLCRIAWPDKGKEHLNEMLAEALGGVSREEAIGFRLDQARERLREG